MAAQMLALLGGSESCPKSIQSVKAEEHFCFAYIWHPDLATRIVLYAPLTVLTQIN